MKITVLLLLRMMTITFRLTVALTKDTYSFFLSDFVKRWLLIVSVTLLVANMVKLPDGLTIMESCLESISSTFEE